MAREHDTQIIARQNHGGLLKESVVHDHVYFFRGTGAVFSGTPRQIRNPSRESE